MSNKVSPWITPTHLRLSNGRGYGEDLGQHDTTLASTTQAKWSAPNPSRIRNLLAWPRASTTRGREIHPTSQRADGTQQVVRGDPRSRHFICNEGEYEKDILLATSSKIRCLLMPMDDVDYESKIFFERPTECGTI